MAAMIGIPGIDERINRLEQLAIGLGRETQLLQHPGGPLTVQEQRDYTIALLDALSGLDAARIALARARGRLVRDAVQRGS